MNIIVILAVLAFLSATIWHCIQKAWPHALVAAGLFLLALDATTLIPT